jgi:hypothetical protein
VISGTTGGVASWQPLVAHDVFNASEIEGLGLWRAGPPRYLFATTAAAQRLELVAVDDRAALIVHTNDALVSLDEPAPASERVRLPALPYTALVTSGTHAYAVAGSNTAYRSGIVTIDLEKHQVIDVLSFSGVAVDAVIVDDVLVVADADGALRLYRVGDEQPVSCGSFDLTTAFTTERP